MKKYFSPNADIILVVQPADIITVSYNKYGFDSNNATLDGIGSGDDITAYRG